MRDFARAPFRLVRGTIFDLAIERTDVRVSQAKYLADAHAAFIEQAQQQAIPKTDAGIQQPLNIGGANDFRQPLRCFHTHHSVSQRLCPVDVVKERLVRTLRSEAA